MAKLLITGARSGIGRYLAEELRGIGFTRQTAISEFKAMKNKEWDAIIHCAFNSSRQVAADSLYSYLEDNVFLTKKLVAIPHKKFIFFSSIDVYPESKGSRGEEEKIDVASAKNLYAVTKLMSEAIIQNYSPNYLILRCSAFLGKYSRKNSLLKIIEDQKCSLTLSGNSVFNYILYTDVLDFIKLALAKDLQGIYNLAASENITLGEVADWLGKKVNFGDFFYNAGNISNDKAKSLCALFSKTSKDVINQFISQRVLK